MRLIGRLFSVLFGYLVASLAAGLVIVVATVGLSQAGYPIVEPVGDMVAKSVYVGGIAGAFVAALAAPMAIVALTLAEIFAIRKALFYVLAAGLVAALGYVTTIGTDIAGPPSPLAGDELATFVAAGFVAGFVYWALTGRRAGLFRRAPA